MDISNKKQSRGTGASDFHIPGGLLPALAFCVLFFAFLNTFTSALAAIDNTARAVGVFSTNPVISAPSSQSVPVVPANPQLSVTKNGVLNDDDGTPGLSAGDTISYTVEVSNPGNVSLTGIVVNDPLLALALQSGDADGDLEIDPGEVWIFTGNYTVTPIDLATSGGGDNDIDNTVTVDSNETGPQTASDETLIDPAVGIDILKVGVLNDDDGTPGLSAGDTISYQIEITNTGTAELTSVVLNDTLAQSGVNTPLSPVRVSGDVNNNNILNASEVWVYTVDYTITQQNIDDGGNIVNTASVNTDQIGPRTSEDTQILDMVVDAFTMKKLSNLVDGDSDNLADIGEAINYTFRFTNTGNRTLANLVPVDPLPGLSAIACGRDGDGDGDIDLLLPGDAAICTASYTVTAQDVANGQIDNTATANATRQNGLVPVVEDNSADDNSTSTPADSNFELEITKTIASAQEVLPNVVEIEYLIEVENQSPVTQTNVTVRDNVSDAVIAPAELTGSVTIVSVSGFSGSGGANPNFDGVNDTALLEPGVDLPPSAVGSITVRILVDRRGASLETSNVAFVTTDLIPADIPSDDPTATPGNSDDQNPTQFADTDGDGDGAPDSLESASADRDGDGIADAEDFDPTGYFYCEADGRILTGGLIAIQNLSTGRIQSGVGSSNDITILQDGSNGFYQFYVTAPGTYRLLPTLPPEGVASTSRASSGTLDVTSLLPDNPGVLGSGEMGNTGFLANFEEVANPFFLDFEIEFGDPSIFNNNIPLTLCGTPELRVAKQLLGEPDVQPDASADIRYRLIASNTGNERLDNLSLTDDLDETFGRGNHQVRSVSIRTAPTGFNASVNPFYNGAGNAEVLTAGGSLGAGERIAIELVVNVTVPNGTYTNELVGNGEHPDGTLLDEETASVDVEITHNVELGNLIITKSTPVAFAPLGATVPYTITVENPNAFPVTGADIIDRLPRGFTYVPGSAEIDGVPVEPVFNKPDLVWEDQTIAAGATVTFTLDVILGAGITGTEFTNFAFAIDAASGQSISNRAQATIELEIESVFQCSQIIGRVFDDLDRDGYHDPGEPGMPGVRLATVNGLLITTDEHGRYHITCDSIPDDRIGSNYILKLDDGTLPTGYRLTSENPRVVRLTRGKLVKLNFAVANLRRITLALEAQSFVGQSTELTSDAIQEIARILPVLEEERTILVLAYETDDGLRDERLEAIRTLVLQAWKSRKRPYRLKVEELRPGLDFGRLIIK